MPRPVSLRQRVTELIPELARFGVVPTHIGSAGDLTFEAGFFITAVVYLGWHAIAKTGRETTLTT